jgi:hypothetical protein
VPFKNKRIGLFSDLKLNYVNERRVDLESVRTERRERLIGLGVIVAPGWRTEIEAGLSTSDYRYEDPGVEGDELAAIARRLDRDESAFNVEASYRFAGRTRALLELQRKRINFINTFVANETPLDRDTTDRRVLGGFDFGEGGSLAGSIKVGWGWINAADPRLADLSELIGEGEVAYRLDSRTRLILSGERLPGFSVYQANAYYMLTEGGIRGVRYINRLVGVELGIRQGRLRFPESELSEGRSDDYVFYEAGVRLRMFRNDMGRRIEYSIRVGKYERTSSNPDFDGARTTFGFGAVLGY